jgi:hypothetical protein
VTFKIERLVVPGDYKRLPQVESTTMSTLLAFVRVERHVVRLNAQLRALEE